MFRHADTRLWDRDEQVTEFCATLNYIFVT